MQQGHGEPCPYHVIPEYPTRHCEERSDVAISIRLTVW
jgi:hypothetical protein